MTIENPVKPLQLSDGELRFYRDEGYLFLPGLLDDATAAELKAEVLDVVERSNDLSYQGMQRVEGSKGKLIQTSQYLCGGGLDRFVNSAEIASVASQLMEGPATLYLPFTALKGGGGGGRFHFHQDNQYTPFDGPGINIWFALAPMTPENGCLQIVPRSHLNGTLASVENPDGDGHRTVAQDPTRFLPIRMRAGDAVAFSRLTLHGSGVNSTDEPRVGYALQFHRDDVFATWDGDRRLLKDHPRWPNIAPVDEITAPSQRSQDGH